MNILDLLLWQVTKSQVIRGNFVLSGKWSNIFCLFFFMAHSVDVDLSPLLFSTFIICAKEIMQLVLFVCHSVCLVCRITAKVIG